MTRFEKFITIIFQNEGILSDNINDKGGITKYGISKNAYPNLDIKNLTIDQAKEIYRTDYYNRLRIDDIKEELLSLHVFDFGVNAGITRSIVTLQNVIGVKADALFGSGTLEKVNSQNWSTEFIQARITYYKRIATGRNLIFLKGWQNRVENCTKLLK